VVKKYRSDELSGITVLGVFLYPKWINVQEIDLGRNVMQRLTCADPDDECTDRFITEDIGVTDLQDVKTKSKDMMEEVLKEITATASRSRSYWGSSSSS